MLDTNMCIYLMKNQPAQVARKFAECYVGDVVISAITYAELEYGVAVSSSTLRARRDRASLIQDIPIVVFDGDAATAYGLVRYATRERKSDVLDKLIAAHAIALDVILVTNNEKDFMQYPRLRIENWVSEG